MIHSLDWDSHYLEHPWGQFAAEYQIGYCKLHSRNKQYFGWKPNEDGTISSENDHDLVLGYGLVEGCGNLLN